MGKALKSAIQEVLTIFASRCNIRVSSLFEWAKKAFKKKLPLPSTSKSLELPDIVVNALQKAAFKRKHESTSDEDSEDEIVNVLANVSKGSTSLEDICVMCCKSDNIAVVKHPFFIGGVCKNCRMFITEIIASPKGQMNNICILCGQGGNLVYCCNSSCLSAYCETCIDYMTPKETLTKILKDNNWKCYLCVPNPDDGCLIKKRKVYLAVSPPPRSSEKSSICVLGLTDEVMSILMEKMIAIDTFSYMLPSSSNGISDDFTEEEIKDINPDFIYASFFVSSTAENLTESRESFYVLFYRFMFRLIMTRTSDPYVLFMYMCDAEILDIFIERRIKRFLQVDPVKITLCKKTVLLWSNLPAIKGIKNNQYNIKKSRGLKFIEEDILNKFLEPLKNIFKQV